MTNTTFTQELCDRIEALNVELQEAKEEVNDQKRLVASFKEENKKKESKLDEMQRNEVGISPIPFLKWKTSVPDVGYARVNLAMFLC